MPRHIVCITFDFDAMSGFVARGLTTPTSISRGEFGAVAVRRLLPLLKRFGITSSFFIPGVVIGTYPRESAMIVEAGHEVGHHGWTHVTPASLSRAEEEEHLLKGMAAIKKLSGRNPRGYRSPAWDLSPHTVELLLQHGFVYESSMMGDDYTPYWCRQGDVIPADGPMSFGQPTTLIEMPISWSLDDYPHFEFLRTKEFTLPGLQNANGVLENFFDDFVWMQKNVEWGVLTYTFHPYVIGRGHRILMLERLLEKLAAGGATFMSMEQAAAEFAARAKVKP
ncbi:MAG: polysaccharide deacetylase [Reyranellaceae bacterium]